MAENKDEARNGDDHDGEQDAELDRSRRIERSYNDGGGILKLRHGVNRQMCWISGDR